MAVARGVSRPFWNRNVVEHGLITESGAKTRTWTKTLAPLVRDNEIRVVQLTSRFYTGGTLGWLKIQHITLQGQAIKKKPSVIWNTPPTSRGVANIGSSDSNATEEAPQSELMGAGNK